MASVMPGGDLPQNMEHDRIGLLPAGHDDSEGHKSTALRRGRQSVKPSGMAKCSHNFLPSIINGEPVKHYGPVWRPLEHSCFSANDIV